MSLVGFKITNHPQQVAKRGASDKVDERITPGWLFDSYHARFGFTLDAAANERNAKVKEHFSLERDGLRHGWAPHRVWCNPPYSNLGHWLQKAHAEFAAGCPSIVLLLPANRTEQGWWQDYVEPYRDQPGGFLRTEFLRSRFNFGAPGNEAGKYNSSPPFGCVAVIFSRESYSKVVHSDSKNRNGSLLEDSNPLIYNDNLAEWTGLEPATPGVTGPGLES